MDAGSKDTGPGDAEGGEADEGTVRLSIRDAASMLLEECRMVVPGVQALLGFQFVATFAEAFWERLSDGERRAHLAAVLLVVAALALVMAPAAYHRQAEPHTVSRRFVRLASRLMMASMPLLAAGMCLDAYLVGRMILESRPAAAGLAAAVAGLFASAWLVLPRSERLRRLAGGPSGPGR